jgi:hypothetical protein
MPKHINCITRQPYISKYFIFELLSHQGHTFIVEMLKRM